MRVQLPTDQESNQMWNATIAPGVTVNVGFNANHNGTNNKPTSFTLDGMPCSSS